MNKIKNKIELLAPAKNKECAFVAINSGADAVYIGCESFGARKKAGNSLEDIKEIVDYAHKFLVKIYVTVNTIIYENEIKDVEKLVWNLYEIGVDAVIFQDFSFFKMNLPPIALHASTQCNNDDLKKIVFLKKCNVQRVVLPREFSLSEIKEVTENVGIETEVFVHGALCVCYSGQCYFSDYVGKRSANRGDCAQPCRKKYSMVDENGKTILKSQYLLSMKDFSLADSIKDLKKAGVTSLKIEGRLKDKQYVKNVVLKYRRIIDSIDKDASTSIGVVFDNGFESKLEKTFNRGFTNFYFDGKRKQFINPSTPKFLGEELGKVKSISGRKIFFEKGLTLAVSDGISFFDKNGDLTGTTVTTVDSKSFEVRDSSKISVGTVIYRNFDAKFVKSLESAYIKRKLPLEIEVTNANIIIKSHSNVSVIYKLGSENEKASNLEKAKETISKQLSKLGDTDFYAQSVKISQDFDLFLPVSKINEIRRNLIFELEEKLKQNYEFQRRNPDFEPIEFPHKNIDYSFNVSNEAAKDFYENCGCSVNELSPEIAKPKKAISLMKTKHCLRDFTGICLKKTKDSKDLFLSDEYGNKFPLEFDCKKCIMKIKEPG